MKISSADTTLSTAMKVNDGTVGGGSANATSAYGEFFSEPGAVGVSAVGTSLYFRLSAWPKGIEAGDILELYETDYHTPSRTFTISSLDSTNMVLTLTSSLDTDDGSFTFTTEGQVPPFVRIRKTKKNNYVTLSSALGDWQDLAVNEDVFFANLNAVINPLLVNKNPTAAQVNNAKVQLQSLQTALTSLQTTLGVYSVSVVPQIDTLVTSFLEEGADRAVDILLQGRFSTFFGLSQEEVSYAGAAMKAIKEVQREDLPVRKTGRDAHPEQALVASYEEPDANYDRTDASEFGQPDSPASFDKDYPGKTF
jgi:hypothetical protein